MSDGLTYETRSQAETMADDYHRGGYVTEVVKTRDGKFKVLLKSGARTLPEEEEELEEEEISGEVGKEIEFEKEERKEARQAARRLPGEITKRKLEVRHKELERANEVRVRMGMERGSIMEVRDPETYKVIDYKLVVRGIEQRAAETISKKVPEAIGKAPMALGEFTGGIVESASKHISVKGGMKASIPGQAPEPRAIIAALPQRAAGVIGTTRPAIGKMGEVEMGKIGVPYARTANRESLGKSPLKKTPGVEPLAANGQRDVGFARMPGLRKPKRTQEEE